MKRRLFWLLVILEGVTLTILLGGGALLALVVWYASGAPLSISESLPLASTLALGIGWGVPLMLQGWAGYQGRSTRPFAPRQGQLALMILTLIFLTSLGALVTTQRIAPALFLPPIHVLTMALIPLTILGMVGKSMHDLVKTWREMTIGVIGGGSLGLLGALLGEALAGILLITLIVIIATIIPNGLEQIFQLVNHLQDPTWLADMDNLSRLLLRPTVAIPMGTLTVIIVPVIEEIVKASSVAIFAFWKRPSPARAFLWGVASGAGFALAENMFNGAISGPEGWAPMVISRLGATALHSLTGGLVGWGWGKLWREGTPLPLLKGYGVAVTIHSLWNAAAMGSVLLSASTLTQSNHTFELTQAAMLILALTLGMLSIACLIALPMIGQRLTQRMALEQK